MGDIPNKHLDIGAAMHLRIVNATITKNYKAMSIANKYVCKFSKS